MTPAVLRTALRRQHSCSHSLAVFHGLNPYTAQPAHVLQRQQIPRRIHTTRPLCIPDRPTSLTNMLASGVPPAVQVMSVSPTGIKLADGLVLTGPVIFLEGKVFLWDVPGISGTGVWEGWTKAHWEVFDVVVPKPEILIFGTGPRMALVPGHIRGYVRELGIQMDVMDTKNACSTYNLLAEEGRRVAAALLPVEPKRWMKK